MTQPTQPTEKICFLYNGSPEAEQALKWVNETFDRAYGKGDGIYYYNHLLKDCSVWSLRPEAIEVPPAEFLRIVKGESEWTPKYGEEVEVSDDLAKWHKRTYIGKNPFKSTYPYITVMDDASIIAYTHIRPVRKSVQDELTDIIQDHSVVDLILTRFNVTPKVND